MTDEQFWTQTAIQIASVLATLILAGLAVWGTSIRSKFVGPKLKLKLFDPKGERIDLTDGSQARYYHLRVINERRSAQANNVRVVLTKVMRPAADGTIPSYSLTGPVQLVWQHGHSMPQYPTIGPSINCDLGSLVNGKGFQLCTMFVPNNLDPVVLGNQKIKIEAIAISDETESDPLCIEIAWDGTWEEDSNEMLKHMVVKEVNCT